MYNLSALMRDKTGETVGSLFDVKGSYASIPYGFMNERSKGAHCLIGACHAQMGDVKNFFIGDEKSSHRLPRLTKFLSALHFVEYDISREESELYWSMLFDDASPYASLFNNLSFIYSKHNPEHRVGFSVDLEDQTSTQLLGNLAIASRLPKENTRQVRFANRMYYEWDFSIAETLWFLGNFYWTGGTHGYVEAPEFVSHYAWNTRIDLELLRKRAPKTNPSQTIGNYSNYMPCNFIWDNSIWGVNAELRKNLHSSASNPITASVFSGRAEKFETELRKMTYTKMYAEDRIKGLIRPLRGLVTEVTDHVR